jgi:hypothetical protein
MKCIMRLVPEEHTDKWIAFECVVKSGGKHKHSHHPNSLGNYKKVKMSRVMWDTRIAWGKRGVIR